MLIVVEGIDGSGKSSVVSYLKDKLEKEGYDVVTFKEPTKEIPDDLSSDEELEFFLRDREENVKLNVLPALEKGRVVILDRFYLSTVAYQSATRRKVNVEEIKKRAGVRPDLTIFLDVDPKVAMERIKRRGKTSRFENLAFLEEVRRIYLENLDDSAVVLDANAPFDVVCKNAEEVVKTALKKFLYRSNAKESL